MGDVFLVPSSEQGIRFFFVFRPYLSRAVAISGEVSNTREQAKWKKNNRGSGVSNFSVVHLIGDR